MKTDRSISSKKSFKLLNKNIIQQSRLFWVLLLFIIIASIVSPNFTQVDNIINILRQVSIVGIIAVGMTFVILTGGIDLSVGSIVAVVAVVSAQLLAAGIPIFLVLILGALLGALIGGINGLGVAKWNIPPFIMTLGIMVAATGFALTLANGQPISLGKAATSFYWLGGGSFLGLPVPVWIFILVVFSSIIVLKYTSFGRNVYAVGDNKEAARLSGINVKLTEFSVYSICGFLSSITALILISRLTVGEPTAGTGYELDAIAMVVIGGTSLAGGQGGVIGTVFGAAIIALISNILNLMGVNPFTQQIVKGAIIVLAVYLETRRRKL
ncbi:ribose ABC transporter permease [Bacillus sp. FJAT-50079]|nr:ribose ABC transporter permease [Bacillus sp. FJAT-50079]